VDWKHEVVEQLDWHWRMQARPRMEGVTDDEFFWEPVPGAWTVRPRPDRDGYIFDWAIPTPDPEPVTTIGWRLCHLVQLFEVRSRNHFGDPLPTEWWDAIDWPGDATRALEMLDASYAAWMAGVRSLDDDGMADPVGPSEGPWHEHPYAALVLHVNREAIHHSAEVALLRDLYRAKP
jgi:hypothetical protein